MSKIKNHILQLNSSPFESIQNRTKTIEMRLYDEKRQQIHVGDTITFLKREDNSQQIIVKVKALHRFISFDQLYQHFDKRVLGYKQNEVAKAEDMQFYYSQEDINKYGVVGIEIEVL